MGLLIAVKMVVRRDFGGILQLRIKMTWWFALGSCLLTLCPRLAASHSLMLLHLRKRQEAHLRMSHVG